MITIDDAAQSLHETFKDNPWYTCVGIGKYFNENVLFIYVDVVPQVIVIPFIWHGFTVIVRQCSKMIIDIE